MVVRHIIQAVGGGDGKDAQDIGKCMWLCEQSQLYMQAFVVHVV